jgi:ABC-type methionine transport system ATPase subunit
MIALYDVTVHRRVGETPLFDGLSLEVDSGEWVSIVGPQAAGKSVLFSCISARATPRSGRVVLGGRNTARLDQDGWATLRRRIGACEQRPMLLEERSVTENLLVADLAREQTGDAPARVDALVSEFDLDAVRERAVSQLCDGRRRLIGALRATVGTPPLIVLDGVFDAGQPWSDRLADRLKTCVDAGSTVVTLGRRTPPDFDGRCLELSDGTLSEGTSP